MTQVRTRGNRSSARVSGNGISQAEFDAGLDLKLDKLAAFSTVVTAGTYTILAADSAQIVEFTNACTVTVPPDLSTGFQCEVFAVTSVLFAAGVGVTIQSEGLNLATAKTSAVLTHKGSNIWLIRGKLT